jgi:phage I-like protein
MNTLLSSLNSQKDVAGKGDRSAAEGLAFNAESGAPEWIMLIPAGRLVVGRDGRKFTVSDPQAIIAASEKSLPLPIDYEHDFEFRRPGDNTPAAGWIEALEVRDYAIWGRVTWTPKAANSIVDREYRFISPAFLHTNPPEADVRRLTSAALVHRPNFVMPALNSQQDQEMDKDLLKALGLPETADAAAAIAAVNSLTTPPLTKFMPRADYDAVLTRATNAEARLLEVERASAQARAEQLVDQAVAAGKIAPVSREHYLKIAVHSRADVEALLATSPAILTPGEDKDLKKGELGNGGALSAEEKAMCAQLDLTEEQFIKARG